MDSRELIASVWQSDDGAGVEPRPTLTMDRILDAVIAIAARDGIAAVSMARVASAVGFTPMALYRHVESKAVMMELAVDRAVGVPRPGLLVGNDWHQGLHAFAQELSARYRQHAWVLNVKVSGPPILPGSVKWMEAGLQILRAAGLRPDQQVAMLTVLTGFVRGFEQMYGGVTQAPDASGQPNYGEHLSTLIAPAQFPALAEAIAAGVFADVSDSGDPGGFGNEMRFGIDLIILGIEATVSAAD